MIKNKSISLLWKLNSIFYLNSPNYANYIGVLKARALNLSVKILDGVDQAAIQIRHHRMLSLVPSIFHLIMDE